MAKLIHSFDDVSVNNTGTLIICDIDDTLLRYERNLHYFYTHLKHSFPEFTDYELKQLSSSLYATYIRTRKPSATDYDGFIRMMKKVMETNSKLIFLTARNECSDKYTQQEFKDIGICYEYFNVFYTNNEKSKADYIRDNIDLDGVSDIIFIDDQLTNLNTMKTKYPSSECYRFNYKKSSNKGAISTFS